MKTDQAAPTSIDEYLAGFPGDAREIMEQIRATIRKAAPDAEETISYGMPTFKLDGHYLVYFAGYRKHVSVYPAPVGNPDFAEEMAVYGSGKGTVQFPLDRPVPFDLITRIVTFRMRENAARPTAKGKKKT